MELVVVDVVEVVVVVVVIRVKFESSKNARFPVVSLAQHRRK